VPEDRRLIPGFPGYLADAEGSIWLSHHAKPGQWVRRAGSPDEHGYLSVCIKAADGRRKTVGIHRLVLMAFYGPRPGMQACHFPDPDPSNNRLSNLRWSTPAQNQQDSIIQRQLSAETGFDAKASRRHQAIRLYHEGVALAVIGRRVGLSIKGVKMAIGIK
jgi:hypothetical protein